MMAANQVDSGSEACILPVQEPPAVQPTIFQTHQDFLVAFQGLDRLKRVCTGTWMLEQGAHFIPEMITFVLFALLF